MKVFDSGWRTFAVRAVVLGAVVFGAVRLAVARPGVAGGPARSFVTVAGTLSGVTGTAMARFRFYDARVGGTMLCESSVMIDGGAFSKEVPLEGTGATGPRCLTMFDGTDVFVEVAINETPVGERNPVNPVPYAHFASVAGALVHKTGWQQIGMDRYVFSAYLRGADVPACVSGFMTYNIGLPSSVPTARDTLFSGVIDVMTRPDVREYWVHTSRWVATFGAYTHSENNLILCSLPNWSGNGSTPTTPSVCYDPQSTPLPNYIQIRRPDADSARLNVIVPCGSQQMNRLSINIDAFIRRADN